MLSSAREYCRETLRHALALVLPSHRVRLFACAAAGQGGKRLRSRWMVHNIRADKRPCASVPTRRHLKRSHPSSRQRRASEFSSVNSTEGCYYIVAFIVREKKTILLFCFSRLVHEHPWRTVAGRRGRTELIPCGAASLARRTFGAWVWDACVALTFGKSTLRRI